MGARIDTLPSNNWDARITSETMLRRRWATRHAASDFERERTRLGFSGTLVSFGGTLSRGPSLTSLSSSASSATLTPSSSLALLESAYHTSVSPPLIYATPAISDGGISSARLRNAHLRGRAGAYASLGAHAHYDATHGRPPTPASAASLLPGGSSSESMAMAMLDATGGALAHTGRGARAQRGAIGREDARVATTRAAMGFTGSVSMGSLTGGLTCGSLPEVMRPADRTGRPGTGSSSASVRTLASARIHRAPAASPPHTPLIMVSEPAAQRPTTADAGATAASERAPLVPRPVTADARVLEETRVPSAHPRLEAAAPRKLSGGGVAAMGGGAQHPAPHTTPSARGAGARGRTAAAASCGGGTAAAAPRAARSTTNAITSMRRRHLVKSECLRRSGSLLLLRESRVHAALGM